MATERGRKMAKKRFKAEDIILKLRESKDNKESALRGSSAKRPMNPKIVEYRESLYQQIKEIHKGGANNGRS